MSKIRKILGNRIKELRNKKHITQERLAEISGLDQRTISHCENGRSMSMSTLQILIEALDVDVKEFFQFENIVDKSDEEMIKEITEILPTLSGKELHLYYKIISVVKNSIN